MPEFELSEIRANKHWMVYRNSVYDISQFIAQGLHPGGDGVFDDYLNGGDIEQAMEDADHSAYAYNLLKEYKIGTVKGKQAKKDRHAQEDTALRGYTRAEVEGAVDLASPVLPQVSSIGDKYWPWLHTRPIFKDGMTIFPLSALEMLSRWPWWYIWVLWTPVIAYQSATSIVGRGVGATALGFVFGALLWTLVEYVMHRFVFHREVSSNAGNVFHYFAHGVHHLTPTDQTRLTFPPPFAALIGVLFYHTIYAVFGGFGLPWQAIFAGFIVGYVAYDTAHFLYHHTDYDNRLFRHFKTFHLNHHYKNENCNFGVSVPLWDHVFGTYDPDTFAQKKATRKKTD